MPGKFEVGQVVKRTGRPKGSKTNRQIRSLAQRLFDQQFWYATKKRMRAGTEKPAIVLALLAYAYGKPGEQEQQGKTTTHINVGALSVLSELGATAALPVRTEQRVIGDQRALEAEQAAP